MHYNNICIMSYHSLVIFLSQTAQDISEVNVLALFERLSTRGSSLLNKDEPNQSSSWCQPTDSIITEEKIQNDPPASQTHPAEQQTQAHGNIILCQNIVNVLLLTVKCCKPIKPKQSVSSYSFLYICFVSLCVFADLLNLSGVKVSFLSPDSLSKLSLKNKYSNLFNTIFCSARWSSFINRGFEFVCQMTSIKYLLLTQSLCFLSMVHQLDSSLREITAPDAALVIELAKWVHHHTQTKKTLSPNAWHLCSW